MAAPVELTIVECIECGAWSTRCPDRAVGPEICVFPPRCSCQLGRYEVRRAEVDPIDYRLLKIHADENGNFRQDIRAILEPLLPD